MQLFVELLVNHLQVSCQISSEYFHLVIHQNYGHGQLCLTSITNSPYGSLRLHTASRSCGKLNLAIQQTIRRLEDRRDLENLTILRLQPSKLGHGRRSKIALFSKCLAVTMIGRGLPFTLRCSFALELEAFSLPGVCANYGIVVLKNYSAVYLRLGIQPRT